MKQQLKSFFLLTAAVVMFALLYSCQDDDDQRPVIDPTIPYVTMSADGVPEIFNPTGMSRELFQRYHCRAGMVS